MKNNLQFGLKQSIIKDINKIFHSYSGIEKAILFGSRANETYSEVSDIDIAIVGSIDFKILLQIRQKIDDLNLPYKIDLLDYYKIADEGLKKEIEKGVNLFELSLVRNDF